MGDGFSDPHLWATCPESSIYLPRCWLWLFHGLFAQRRWQTICFPPGLWQIETVSGLSQNIGNFHRSHDLIMPFNLPIIQCRRAPVNHTVGNFSHVPYSTDIYSHQVRTVQQSTLLTDLIHEPQYPQLLKEYKFEAKLHTSYLYKTAEPQDYMNARRCIVSDAGRNDNVIITPKRRHDVVLTW